MNKHLKFCINCGKNGHSFHNCSKPIMSNGIIAFTKKDKDYKYLLICRKDTLGYVEFLRGKYKSVYNYDYIKNFDFIDEVIPLKNEFTSFIIFFLNTHCSGLDILIVIYI